MQDPLLIGKDSGGIQMSVVSKIAATFASLAVAVTGLLVLTVGAGTASAETDWNRPATTKSSVAETDWNGITNGVNECDWNKPVPC
jgi:hypothetical protein